MGGDPASGPRRAWGLRASPRLWPCSLPRCPQVFRLPVQECLRYENCTQCLGSRDPYCGWCIVEGR